VTRHLQSLGGDKENYLCQTKSESKESNFVPITFSIGNVTIECNMIIYSTYRTF